MWLLAITGAIACLISVYWLPIQQLDLQFLLLALVTAAIGSRIGILIPRVNSEITVSDTLIFLTLLLYDGEAAVLVAAADAFCSSLRFSKRWLTILCNSGMLAVSTFVNVWTLRLCFGPISNLTSGGAYTTRFLLAIFIMATVQYVLNSGLTALRESLKRDMPFWHTWHKYFLWTSITYYAGASAAGLITKLVAVIGFYAFIITVPIIGIVYITYRTYRQNIASAESHVEELNRHIAEQERIRRALQESEAHFRIAFEHAAGIVIVTPDLRCLKVNHSLCNILGYSETQLLESSFQQFVQPDDLTNLLVNIDKLLKGQLATYQVEHRYLYRRGPVVWVLLSISIVQNPESEAHLIFQIQDITDRKRAEEQLVHDALHDGLTGLPNRALFMDHLKQAVERGKRRKDYLYAVLFLDLDRFKIINDSLGHLVGDQLLVGIARRLETCLRATDTVARLGGDEFTILLEDLGEPMETIQVAERIQRELAVPFKLAGQEVFTTVSIGVAPSTTGYAKADDILRDADTAMYRAKQMGKARHVVFDQEMHARAMNLLQLETDLRRALERRELFLNFQPIVALATEQIIGFEALVRWRHSERGIISPMDFIPIAEETGLIIPIGQWVLEEACRQTKQWKEQVHPDRPLFVSVNLSGKQFQQPDLLEQITSILRESGLAPCSLKMEITESLLMENIEAACATLEQLRELGVEVSIDDFGTGYSSLSYLHRLPIDTLKIDRSFVGRMALNDENIEIVRTIVTLAQSLEMAVVAEGIETKEQLAQLRALKCDGGQGYLFSQPLAADAARQFLAASCAEQVDTATAEEWRKREEVDVMEVA